jgi:hypothetical protein
VSRARVAGLDIVVRVMVCHLVSWLMVRAIVTDQACLMRTLGVFANKSLSSFDRSRRMLKLNASEQGRARSSISINRALAAPICVRAPAKTQSRLRQPRHCTRAHGCHLATERGAATLSFRTLGDRGPFAFCGAVSCPANASATTGFMLSTIDVGIRIVAPRSLVVS